MRLHPTQVLQQMASGAQTQAKSGEREAGRQRPRILDKGWGVPWLRVFQLIVGTGIPTKRLKEAISCLWGAGRTVLTQQRRIRDAPRARPLWGTWPRAAGILEMDTTRTDAIDRIY